MQNLILTSLTRDDLKQLLADIFSEHASSLAVSSQSQQVPEELLSITEAARLLKVSKPTLWTYTKEGVLQKHRMGAKVYYKRSELLGAIEQVRISKQKRRF